MVLYSRCCSAWDSPPTCATAPLSTPDSTFSVWSRLPLTRPLLSSMNMMLYTLSLCPISGLISALLWMSHTCTILSNDPTVPSRPSGEITTELTPIHLHCHH